MTPTDEDFVQVVKNATCYADIFRGKGLRANGTSLRVIKRKITVLGLDTSHFTGKGLRQIGRRLPIEEHLVLGSTIGSVGLKRRLWELGLLKEECSTCGLTTWLGKPITLELDHINGNHTDNRLENLRILCPNCHSQTETHSGKNREKKPAKECPACGLLFLGQNKFCSQACVNKDLSTNPHKKSLFKRPPREVLVEKLSENPRRFVSRALATEHGVSITTVKRWLKLYDLW